MARDDDRDKPTPRAIPIPRVDNLRPPRRETPITTPSPVRMSREQGPMPPKRELRDVREPMVPTVSTAQSAATQALEAVAALSAQFASLERLIRERESSPPSSQVLTFSSSPTPTPAELLEPGSTPVPKAPESRPSLPVRAANATKAATKAVSKNSLVRWVVWGGALFPWVSQVINWIRGVNVGPIVSGLRIFADFLESLGNTDLPPPPM